MAARNLALDSFLRIVSCGLVGTFAYCKALKAYLQTRQVHHCEHARQTAVFFIKRISTLNIAIFHSVLWGGNTFSDDAILFTCDRYDGEQKFQIYINEAEGYVLYNAHLRDTYERE